LDEKPDNDGDNKGEMRGFFDCVRRHATNFAQSDGNRRLTLTRAMMATKA
jgi:hypothetical protein